MTTTIGHGCVVCKACRQVIGRCDCGTCPGYVRYVVCPRCAGKPGTVRR